MSLPSYKLREDLFIKHNIKDVVEQYKSTGHIQEFDKNLWKKIQNTNVINFRDFMLIFEEGFNIGTCGVSSRYLSFSFKDFEIVTGKCNILKGTKGADNGEHVWLESCNYIYDTTLLFKINKQIGYNLFGYAFQEKNSSKQLFNDIGYLLERKMANDKEISILSKKLVKDFKSCKLKSPSLGLY